MAQDKSVQDELALQREILALPRELSPERDLWQGIERQIQDYPQRSGGTMQGGWMPWAVAASFVLAISALVTSVIQTFEAPAVVSADGSISRLEAEYQQVRNPMVESFTEMNKDLPEESLNELYRNLEILEKARRELESQVRENPDNRRLVESLMWIHEQELELLKQDYSRRGRFL